MTIVSSNEIPNRVPTPSGVSQPGEMVVTPDGNLWAIDNGRIDEATLIPADKAVVQVAVVSDPGATGFFQGGPLAGRTVYLDANGNGDARPGRNDGRHRHHRPGDLRGPRPGHLHDRGSSWPSRRVRDQPRRERPAVHRRGRPVLPRRRSGSTGRARSSR